MIPTDEPVDLVSAVLTHGLDSSMIQVYRYVTDPYFASILSTRLGQQFAAGFHIGADRLSTRHCLPDCQVRFRLAVAISIEQEMA